MRHWIDRLAAMLRRKPGQRPTAFAGLRAVSETGLEAFDGVDRTLVPWTSVRRITASMGRQQYDMTQVLRIDYAAGRSIFLPQVDALWAPFVAAMSLCLPEVLPVEDWGTRLSADPEASICIYRRLRIL